MEKPFEHKWAQRANTLNARTRSAEKEVLDMSPVTRPNIKKINMSIDAFKGVERKTGKYQYS